MSGFNGKLNFSVRDAIIVFAFNYSSTSFAATEICSTFSSLFYEHYSYDCFNSTDMKILRVQFV